MITTLLIFALICAVYLLIKRTPADQEKNRIASLFEVRNLLFFIKDAQYKVAQKYRITTDEEDAVNKIVQDFMFDLMKRYFRGNLSAIKGKYAIESDVFFFYRLCNYLFLLECNGLYSYLEELPCDDPKRVFYKVYYIAQTVCANSEAVRVAGGFYNEMDAIEQHLK